MKLVWSRFALSDQGRIRNARRRCRSGTTWCAIGIYSPLQQLAYAAVARISQRVRPMQKPPLDPDIADEAPSASDPDRL